MENNPFKKQMIQNQTTVKTGEGGVHHQYSQEEIYSFVCIINHYVKDDELLKKYMPINPDNEEVFDKLKDGLILAKVVDRAQAGSINFKAMNTKEPLNIFQIKENLNLVIESAKSIGCKIINIFPESVTEKKEHLVLGLLWQLVRACCTSGVFLKDNAFLEKLVDSDKDKDLDDLKSKPAEEILKRWFNYHLAQAKHDRRVNNFSEDIKDGINYTILLNQLNGDKCNLAGLEAGEEQRAQKVIDDANKLGVYKMIRGKDITTGNSKLNLLFIAEIYNACCESVKSDNKMDNDSREERSFRLWANHLGVTGADGNPYFFSNLYQDCADALMLLKMMEKIGPSGCVDWKKCKFPAKNQFESTENGNYAVKVAKEIGFTVIGIDGKNIINKDKKSILAILWQMVRKHCLDTIGGIDEAELLKWANTTAAANSKDVSAIKSWQDSSLKTSKFLFALLAGANAKCFNWDNVKTGDGPDELEQNATYFISSARKAGVKVFCVWEDIKEVKAKMILTIIASIKQTIDTKGKK